MLYCWMINHHNTTGVVKKCRNQQFLSIVWLFIADNNVNNEPLVMHDSQGHIWIAICW